MNRENVHCTMYIHKSNIPPYTLYFPNFEVRLFEKHTTIDLLLKELRIGLGIKKKSF